MVDRRKSVESSQLVKAAFELAGSLDIPKLLVQANELKDVRLVEKHRGDERLVWLVRGDFELPLPEKSKDKVISIPDTRLTRMSQVKIGLYLAVLNHYVELDESIVCLSGVAGSERLDTLIVANPRRDFPWFKRGDKSAPRPFVATRELARVLDIALRLAAEGREGKPLGTIFVIGDLEILQPHLRPLVLNPFEGHPRRARNVHTDELMDTLREFASMDGAFVISGRGVVETAGVYLDAPAKNVKVRKGLGARHTAAAAITAATDTISVVVSESSGAVTVFHGGLPVLELERPEPRTR